LLNIDAEPAGEMFARGDCVIAELHLRIGSRPSRQDEGISFLRTYEFFVALRTSRQDGFFNAPNQQKRRVLWTRGAIAAANPIPLSHSGDDR
jgi:hypothetical protein